MGMWKGVDPPSLCSFGQARDRFALSGKVCEFGNMKIDHFTTVRLSSSKHSLINPYSSTLRQAQGDCMRVESESDPPLLRRFGQGVRVRKINNS